MLGYFSTQYQYKISGSTGSYRGCLTFGTSIPQVRYIAGALSKTNFNTGENLSSNSSGNQTITLPSC